MWADINFTRHSAQPQGLPRPRWLHKLVHLPDGLLQRVAEWSRRRALWAELESLEERDLQDLGIGRGDFRAIVAGTYKREPDAFEPGSVTASHAVRFNWPDDSENAPPAPEAPPLPALLFPVLGQPSWFEQYWYGTRASDRRR